MSPAVETIAAGITAAVLGVGYAVEKLEKRGLVRNLSAGDEPPQWAKKQNRVLVLLAEQSDGVDATTTAEYLDVDKDPTIEDLVTNDQRTNSFADA